MLKKLIIMEINISRCNHSITLSNLIKQYMSDIFELEGVGVLFWEPSTNELFSLLSNKSQKDPYAFTKLKYSDNFGVSGKVVHNKG